MLTHQSKRQILALSVITTILTIVLPTVDLEGVALADLPGGYAGGRRNVIGAPPAG